MNRKLLLSFVFLFSPSAFADVDYYTFGGFESVVNAFLRLSAIFSNPQYEWYIIAFAIAGVTIGYLIALGKGFLSGGLKGYDALVSLFVVLFGVTLYTVVIRPTTTVHIYDESTNQYQSVGNIPSLIANAVNLPNIMERGMTLIVDASTVYTRSEHANGATLELLLNALNGNPLAHDAYLNRSLYSFVDTCMPPALNSNLYTFDLNALMSSTGDLIGELEKLKSLSVPVLYYDTTNKGGVEVSCTTAYNSLAAILALPSTYNDYRNAICDKSGFDSSNALQLATCRDRLQDMTNLVFGTGVIGSDTELFMSQAIAKTTYETLATYAGTAISDIANYREMSQGYGNVIVAEGWIPTIRSSTLVIILSILPILVLFLVTPMIFKSLHLILTLFIFVGLWGVSDAIVHSIIVDQVGDLMASLKNYNGSVTSFMMAPTDINKGLATFGKLQSMAVILAGFIAGVFFKLSARAFSQMGERLADNVESLGSNTGQEILDPSRRMGMMDGSITAYDKLNMQREMGSQRYGDATRGHNTGSLRTEAKWLDAMSNNNFDYNQAVDTRADIYGGEQAGRVSTTAASAATAGQRTSDYSKDIASTNTGQSLAGTEIDQKNIQHISDTQNLSVPAATKAKMEIAKSGETGAIQANSNPEAHIQTAETNTSIRQAESQVDRENIEYIQQKAGVSEDAAFDIYAATKMAGQSGQLRASVDPDKHVDASTVSSIQHMQDKLSYKEFTESMGIDLQNRTFDESKMKHAVAYGEHQAMVEQLKDLGFSPEELGERNKASELDTSEATAQGREFVVNEGLADTVQEAAVKEKIGQDGMFSAEHTVRQAAAKLQGISEGQVYLNAAGQMRQVYTADMAYKALEAASLSPEKQEAITNLQTQLADIAAGRADSIVVENTSGNMTDNFRMLEQIVPVDSITGGYQEVGESAQPFVAPMSPEEAQNALDLLDPNLAKFGAENQEQLRAIYANGGGEFNYALGSDNVGASPSIVKTDVHAGNKITEDNSHTVTEKFSTDGQTAYNNVFSPESQWQGMRFLDNAIAGGPAAIHDLAHELASQKYTSLDQRDSNDHVSTNAVTGRISGEISKRSLANAAQGGDGDQVKSKTPDTSDGDSNDKGAMNKLGNAAKAVPFDAAIGGEISHTSAWSEHDSSASDTDINQIRIAQLLNEYATSEDKEKAYEEFVSEMAELYMDDRRAAYEAEKDYQNDAYQEANDERNLWERAIDFGAETYDDIDDFITGKDIPGKSTDR